MRQRTENRFVFLTFWPAAVPHESGMCVVPPVAATRTHFFFLLFSFLLLKMTVFFFHVFSRVRRARAIISYYFFSILLFCSIYPINFSLFSTALYRFYIENRSKTVLLLLCALRYLPRINTYVRFRYVGWRLCNVWSHSPRPTVNNNFRTIGNIFWQRFTPIVFLQQRGIIFLKNIHADKTLGKHFVGKRTSDFSITDYRFMLTIFNTCAKCIPPPKKKSQV